MSAFTSFVFDPALPPLWLGLLGAFAVLLMAYAVVCADGEPCDLGDITAEPLHAGDLLRACERDCERAQHPHRIVTLVEAGSVEHHGQRGTSCGANSVETTCPCCGGVAEWSTGHGSLKPSRRYWWCTVCEVVDLPPPEEA